MIGEKKPKINRKVIYKINRITKTYKITLYHDRRSEEKNTTASNTHIYIYI